MGSTVTVAEAVNHWKAELAASAQSSLAVDWASEHAVALETSTTVDRLLNGETIDSIDLGAGEALTDLLIRLDQRRRSGACVPPSLGRHPICPAQAPRGADTWFREPSQHQSEWSTGDHFV